MSAFIVDQAHIDALVAVALHGPQDADAGSPWHRGGYSFSWYTPERAVVEWDGDYQGYMTAMAATERELVACEGLGARHGVAVTASELGDMLLRENVRSVISRYPDTLEGGSMPGPCDEYWEAPYVFPSRGVRRLTCVEALKAIACLEYQSCEHGEWQSSEAKLMLEALKGEIVCSLPGYSAAEWSL